jgi:hypothetical protein
MEFIDNAHCEWDSMWQQLAEYPINNGDRDCAFLGASWEYMGSTEDHHHFRHSMHPHSTQAEYVYIERRKTSKLSWAS